MRISQHINFLLGTITVITVGLVTLISFKEFYIIGIRKRTDGYPFGGESSVPYYYNTPELYSLVNIVWGFLFLTIFIISLRMLIVETKKGIIISFFLTLLMVILFYVHAQIGTN